MYKCNAIAQVSIPIADAESVSWTQLCTSGDLFGKQTLKAINFNRPFLERCCEEALTLTNVIIENTA